MPKISSYIKALLPSSVSYEETKAQYRGRFTDLRSISPHDQNEIRTQVISKLGANKWQNNTDIDLEVLQRYYDCHDLVYSCINLVSSQFALAKLKVKQFDKKTQKYNYSPDHPLQRLLDNPNSSMTGFDLRQAYITHRLLYGTMGSILLRNSMTGSDLEVNRCPSCHGLERNEMCPHILWHFHTGEITQIIPVHLDRLEETEVETPNGLRSYFVYKFENGIKSLVHPNNILTDPKYNPGGSFYGSSPTERVKRWLQIDLGLSKQVGAYLSNNAIPSFILNFKPPKLGEGVRSEDPSTMLEQMSEMWMKKFSMDNSTNRDGNKVKAPAFTYGDLEILRVQDTLKDIVQKPLFYEIQDRIARAYNVPRSYFQLGLEHGVDLEKDNQNFYNYAIAPELDSFKAKIERYILPSYEDSNLVLEWDLSSLGIAAFLIDKKNSFNLKKWEMGIVSLNEARESLQLNPFPIQEEGEARYRVSVMSDGSNTQTGQNNSLQDNRFRSEPETARNAGLVTDEKQD